MGESVPTEKPEYEPATMYGVTTEVYICDPPQDPGQNCCSNGVLWGTSGCMVLGNHISAWLAGNNQCINNRGLCFPQAGVSERLISATPI